MIVQCEQCSTKFKLDDSKITDIGVRVRCAKCKHVFLVKKEAEEANYEKLLGGLDVPEGGEEGAQDSPAFDLSAFGADMENQSPAGEQPPVADAPRKKSAMEIRGTPVSVLTEDASRLLPPDEADAGLADIFAAAGGGEQSAPPEMHNEFDLSAAFADGSIPPEQQGGATEAPSTGTPDEGMHGEVSLQHFDAEERGTGADGSADTDADSAFGQLPDGFSEEHLASTINGVFATDHDDSPAPVASAGPQKIEAGDIDSLDLGGDGWDSPASLDSEHEVPAAGENADHDAAALGFDFNAEAFGDSPAVKPQDEDASMSAPAVQWEASDESAVPAVGNGGASVNGSIDAGTVATMGETMTDGRQVEANRSAAAGDRQDESLAIVFPDAVPPSASMKGKKTDFSFDEDLPPLSIPSRRKESTSMVTTILLVLVLIVAGVAGGGYYLLQEDPALFNRLGLGEAVKLFQLVGGKDAGIAIQGVQGRFVTSVTDGALLVIRGEVVNNSRKPHSTVQVRVTLVRAKGAAPLQKTAYCGKALADEELVTLPIVEIDKRLNDPAGAPAAMELAPGKKIPFVAVFSQVPDDASDYGVEVVGANK